MNQYKVTFKRVEAFYQAILVTASTPDEAHEKAEYSDPNVQTSVPEIFRLI